MSGHASFARYNYAGSHLQNHNAEETSALFYRCDADDMELKQATFYNADACAETTFRRASCDSSNPGDNACWKSERYRKYVWKIVLVLLLLGYLTYTVFVVYLNPDDSVFVCILALFSFFVVVNYVSGSELTRGFRKVWKLRPRLKKKKALWTRR